jgi:tetratricopeptide (TPR) repeat protein
MPRPFCARFYSFTLIFLLGFAGRQISAQEVETPLDTETDIVTEPVSPVPEMSAAELAERVLTQQVLRTYLQLQEQMHSALLAIEKNRDAAEVAAAQNREIIGERLKTIEMALQEQRAQDFQAAESSHRLVLLVAGLFAILGFVAVLAACWLQMRAMTRLTQVATALPIPQGFALPPAGMLGAAEPGLLSREAEHSSNRLRSLVQTLESRVRELEQTAQGYDPRTSVSPKAGRNLPEVAAAPQNTESISRISLLLGKGQSLLHLNEPADALECFDQVLAIDPRHTDALVKKGSALERLKRFEAAVECYDRALAIDDTITLAYLYKGGVFNQLERFNEALECYEHALRTQQKEPLSAVS